jgi:hypothetical protein
MNPNKKYDDETIKDCIPNSIVHLNIPLPFFIYIKGIQAIQKILLENQK